MKCEYYESGRCRSCSELPISYADQLRGKDLHCRVVLGAVQQERAASSAGGIEWLSPVASRELRFRNKAKMVVSGSVEAPVLGILDSSYRGIDLTGCPLYPEDLASSFAPIADFITRARLTPYDVSRRAGELKYVLVTWASQSGHLMVRFVLRTEESVVRIRKHLPDLLAALPRIDVVSVNLQPEHNAIVEGPTEIVLTERETLEVELNSRFFHLPPRAFLQTNTEVAAALYREAQSWVEELQPTLVLDLFCGIGTFGLHLADGSRLIVGVDNSCEAAEGARRSAQSQSSRWSVQSQSSRRKVQGEFFCRDAEEIDVSDLLAEIRRVYRDPLVDSVPFREEQRARRDAPNAVPSGVAGGKNDRLIRHAGGPPEIRHESQPPEDAGIANPSRALAIVNPPRRGIGEKLARSLESSEVRWILYSSCLVESLARDIRSMPGFALRKVRLFDMFPHTRHYEVMALLERRSFHPNAS